MEQMINVVVLALLTLMVCFGTAFFALMFRKMMRDDRLKTTAIEEQ